MVLDKPTPFLFYITYLEPKPNLFKAEKIALTEALVILLDTPTP